jgi:AcrR family transcriptional regulator
VTERRRLEPDERRAQLLAVARKQFGAGTYASVSTSDIAAAAGVARGLINHYFGGKRGLYLEVVRRLVTVPDVAVDDLPPGPVEQRVAILVDRTLTVLERNAAMWLAAIGHSPTGLDDELDRILFQAEEKATDAVLAAANLSTEDGNSRLRAMIRAYGAMHKAATREWLERGTLTRGQVHVLLTDTVLHLLTATAASVQDC